MYLRLKFTATSNHFDSLVNSKPVSQHIKEALDGTTAISALPASVFDINNCVRLGSLPTTVVVSFANSTSSDQNQRNVGCYIQFQKTHSQIANSSNLFRIHQNSLTNMGWQPRLLSSNSTNIVPIGTSTTDWWLSTNVTTNYFTHGVSNCEMQFFISTHWVIWSIIDGTGKGGTAGLFDVESTGQDVWARTLNSLYSPQFFMSSHGGRWPSSSTTRFSEDVSDRVQLYIGSNQMFTGDATFTNRGGNNQGVYTYARGNVTPMIYPDPWTSFFSTKDSIGDTQNYMIPVQFHTNNSTSNVTTTGRATLNGRVPLFWRTTDNAAQTGQAVTVSGTEYRFIRMHPCGTTATSDINAATYLVPTLVGGI